MLSHRWSGTFVIVMIMGFVGVPSVGQPRTVPAKTDESAEAVRPATGGDAPKPLKEVALVQMPPLDLQAIRVEDAVRETQGLAPRYAIPTPVQITPDTQGTWESTNDDMLRWRLRINSPDAQSINLGFGRYHMPAGGRLLIYAADNSRVIRPFTELDNEDHGELWTPPLLSNEIVVELLIPESVLPELELELNSINSGYRGFGAPVTQRSGACNVDVICPEGDDWPCEISSVGVISLGGNRFCTGFMVNNTEQDLTPYFMTARHCNITDQTAPSLMVFWNYENCTCREVDSVESGGPGDGSLNDFQTGSYFLASYSNSDFTLVLLDDDPDPAWDVTFAGWDRSSADPTSAVAIHHPRGDEKRISFENDPTSTTSYLQNGSPGDGTHIRVTDWDLGTTEIGSSGSPLFDQNQRVVGQLHGGFAACGNDESDWYGRFSVSWDGGGTDSTRLSNWLDPGGTGATTVDTTGGEGACCYENDISWVCRIMTKAECDAEDGTFLGCNAECPEGPEADHDGVAVTHYNSPPLGCEGSRGRDGSCTAGLPVDPWRTDPTGRTCQQFDVGPTSPPIPADFFGPGSDPFSGEVCFKGEPLGDVFLPGFVEPFDFGEADTLVRRTGGPSGTGDPFDRCAPPSPAEVTVAAEVIALNLVSTCACRVTSNGGQNPERWDVKVDLSPSVTPPPGTITATKTHCNGGTYQSELHVQARFTFTKVGNPGQVRVLDTGLEGYDYVTLRQPDPNDPQDPDPLWASKLAGETWGSPLCTAFYPAMDGTGGDCTCLVPPGLPANPEHHARKHRYISIDATTNQPNEVSIKVEIAEMNRCQNDLRRSCIDDDDCPRVCAADPDLHSCGIGTICPDGVCIESGPCGPHPDVGLSWYVQEPQTRGAGCPNGMCDEEDYFARVVPDLYVSDWKDECEDVHIPGWTGGCSTLHIGDCEIVPGVKYDVSVCDPLIGDTCSKPLVVETTRKSELMPHYGDVAGPVTPQLLYTGPDDYTSVIDIGAFLLTLKNWGTPNLPQAHPTWIDLHGPGTGIPPQYILMVTDLTMILRAWVNVWPYENSIGGLAPGDCP